MASADNRGLRQSCSGGLIGYADGNSGRNSVAGSCRRVDNRAHTRNIKFDFRLMNIENGTAENFSKGGVIHNGFE